MNKIYKVIWNRVRHCYVVVSEIAKNHGKEHSTNLCVSKRLVALTLAIGLSLSSYAFVAVADSVNLDNGASAYYDDKGNLTIGDAKTVAEGKNQKGEHNTTIGTQTDTLRNVTDGDTKKEGQPLDTDKNTQLVDEKGQAVDLDISTEAGGSTAVGYQNKAEGDNSTAIGNNAKITNKPVTYYVDADGKKTASPENAVWYKDASGNPTKVPQVFRDADGNTTATPQYVHTYTEKDTATGKDVTKTEITSDATKADKKDGQPVYNYQKSDNTPYLYSVTLYQAASNSIAAGTNVTAKGSNAVAVGYNSSADNSAVAIGDTAAAKENAVAIGKDTKASAEGSIALGKGSEADRSGGVPGWDPKTGTASTNSDVAWQSREGALSIGNGGASRQITNVAAGSKDSDAVNLAQLKNAMTHYYSVKTTAETDGKGNNNYLNDGATGDNALAAGVSAAASGESATAVGYNTSASGDNAAAFGSGSKVTDGGVAVGSGATASGGGVAFGSTGVTASSGGLAVGMYGTNASSNSAAFGLNSTTATNSSVAVGTNGTTANTSSFAAGFTSKAGTNGSSSYYGHNIAVGSNTTADNGSSAFGIDATANYQSLAIGLHGNSSSAYATNQSIAVGNGTNAFNFSTAIGNQAQAGNNGSYAVALGNEASALYDQTTAVGSGAKVISPYGTALGSGTSAAYYATALGNSASANYSYATAIGSSAQATDTNATAVGNGAKANKSGATALGYSASATHDYSTAVGDGAGAHGTSATALGNGASANSAYDTAIGSGAATGGGNGTALGSDAKAQSPYATALGSSAEASFHAVAIGDATASSSYALAAGDGATAKENNAVALGKSAAANVEDSVALGSSSTANVKSGKTGLDPHTGTASTDTGTTWVSTLGAVSVGTVDSDGNATGTRQINGLAAGTKDTDAVNVAQLKAMETRINMHYYSVNSTLSGGGSNYDNTGASGTNALAAGPMASATGENAVAIGYGAKAEGRSATAIGKNASATGQYAMAFGGLDTTDKKGNPVTMTNTASGASATAFGQGAQAKGAASLAFGHNTVAGVDGGGQQSVAFGEDTQALGGRSLAFGEKTIAKYNDSVAFGNDTRASSTGATAFGNRTRALSQYATAWGNATVAADAESTAWGTDTIAGAKLDANGAVTNIYTYKNNPDDKNEQAKTATEQMDVHGNLAYIQPNGKTAGIKQMKIDSGGELHDYVVLAGKDGNTYVRDYQGSLWKVNVAADGTVTVDTTAGKDKNGKVYNGKNGAKQSLATTTVNSTQVDITPDNVLTKAHEGSNGYTIDGYANATAFGYSTEASGDNATAFGNDTKASAAGATAFGYQTVASGENATAFGENSIAAAKNSLAALGGTVAATATNAAAIGSGAQATLADSVALGSNSVTTRAKYKNLTSDAEKAAYAKGTSTGSAWEATDNAIAVGNDSTVTRQITGVAAGSLDTDAVNVAQLKAVDARHTTVSVGGKNATADNTVVKGGNLEMTRTTSNGQANYDVSLNKDIVLGQQEESKGGSIVINSVGTFRNYDGQGNHTDYPMKEAVKIDGTTVSVVKNDGSDGGNDQRQVVMGVGQDTGGYVALYDNTGKKPTYIFNAISPGITYLKDKATNPDDANEFGRLEYGDIYNGSTQFIATLDDGLKFSGDQGTMSTVKLNQELSVTGGVKDAASLSDGSNIGVVSTPAVEDKQGNITQKAKLELKLNKDLTGLNTVTAGNAKIGSSPADTLKLTENGAVTEKTAPAGSYVTGLDNKDWSTTNPSYVSGRAATEDQLAAVSGTINQGLSFTTNTKDATNTTDNYKGYKVVNRKLGNTIAIKASDETDNHSYSTKNLTTRIAENGDISILMDENPAFTSVTTSDVIFAGNPDLTDKDGKAAQADTNVHYGAKTLTDSQNITTSGNDPAATRLHYKDEQGHTYELATMDDGQIYAGDIKEDGTADTTGFGRKMNEKTTINGGVTDKDKLTDGNIGVVSNGTDTLTVKLAKDLKDLTSVTTGKTVMDDSGIKITNDAADETKNVVINGDKISYGGNQVTNMGSGADGTADGKPTYNTDTNGANIGDVKNIAGSTTDAAKLTGDSNITVTYNDPTAGGKNTVKLNDSITLGSDADKKVTIDGTAGTITAGDKVSLNGSTGIGSIGGVTIGNQTGVATTKMDGDKAKTEDGTFVTGLTNRTWNPDTNGIVSGRAATEDQLKTVSDTVNAGWELDVNGGKQKDVTPTSRKVNFKQGQNITISGSGDDVTVATADNVRFASVRVGGDADGKGGYTGGIVIGQQSGLKADGKPSANPNVDYYITGLKNTNWDSEKIQSGRAATEDQLKLVADEIKNGTVAGDVFVTGGGIKYNGEHDASDTTSVNNGKGSLKLTLKNQDEPLSIDGLHDYYATSGTVSADGKTLTIARNEKDAEGKPVTFDVDLTNLLNKEKHLIANPADGSQGVYKVNEQGEVTLQVQDAAGNNTPVTISGLDGVKGLNFDANTKKTSDGKVHNVKLGGTIKVQGVDPVTGHDYSADNVTTEVDDNGNITIKLDKALTADTVMVNGKDGRDGQIGLNGKDGKDGTVTTIIRTIGKNGTDGTDGKPGVNGTDGITRIVYQNGKDGEPGTTTHTVATLDDGLKFGANHPVVENGANPVGNKLNSTIDIKGAGTKSLDQYSGKNLVTSVEQDAAGTTTIHVLMDKNISADGVTVGQAGKDGVDGLAGTIGINGKNGVAGTDGKQGITTTIIRTEKGQPGKAGVNGKPGVDGTDITRIVYQNSQDGTDGKDTHTVATLDDGLKFAGDDGQNDASKVITKKLNERLDIVGKAQGDLTDANIGVTKDDAGQLYIRLAKHVDLDKDGTLKAGKATIGAFSNTDLTTNKNNHPIEGSYATGLSNKDWSVTDPEYVSGRAATEDQLAKVSEAIGNATTAAGKRTVVTVNDKSNPAEATPSATAGAYGDYDSTGGNLMIAAKKDSDGVLTYNIKLNDQLAIGQKGEPGVAGKDGKDGKVTVETKGGTTVVIGHDGEPGKDGKDGLFVTGKDGADGKSGVSITGPNGADGTDGKVGISGTDGKDAVSIAGKDGVGHIGLTGPKGADGKNADIDISTVLGKATLDRSQNEVQSDDKDGVKDQASRIQYQTIVKEADGTSRTITHEVATMDDGLKIGANAAAKENAANPVSNKLNSTINIKGSDAKANHTYTDDNLTTTVEQDADGNTTVKVLMDQDITGNSVTVGKDSKDGYDGQEGSIGIAGKNGSDGKDGKQGITTTIIKTEKGQNGKAGEIGKQGAPGVDGKDITRIVYQNGQDGENGQGGKHVVATLDDGLKFAGDDASKTVAKKLNETLQIRGDGTYNEKNNTVDDNGNIKTSVDNGAVKVSLSDKINLHQDGSLTVGGDKKDGSTTVDDPIVIKHFGDKTLDMITGVDKDGTPIPSKEGNKAGDYVTGLDNKDWNVSSPTYVSGRAATEDQLKAISDTIKSNADAAASQHTEITVNDKANPTSVPTENIGQDGYGNYAGTGNDNLLIAAKKDATSNKMTYNIKLNDQLAIGQKGEPGVAGKDGKDGKVTVETKGGTTVVIGHDGEPGKDGKDGLFVTGQDGADGKSGVSITGPDGVAGKDGVDGKVGIAGKDGKDAVSITGKDGVGHIGLTGPKGEDGQNGAMIDISTVIGQATLDKDKNSPKGQFTGAERITYTDSQGSAHEVATMDDGLKFVGDDGTATPVTKKLNDTLQIRGDGTYDATTKTNNGNIQTSVESGTIKVALNKDINLKQTGSLTVGGDKQDDSTDSKDPIVIKHFDAKTLDVITGVDKDGKPTTSKEGKAGDYVTGLDNKDWNVSSPTYVSGRAATEDQLKKVSDAVNSAAATAGKHTVVTVNDKDSNETKAEAATGAFGNYAGADKGNLLIAAKNDHGQMTYNIKLNDQLAIGQKGEPGVAGKDGKDGKVTVETKGGTTVVIGHDGEPGKDGKDGLFVTGKDGADGVSITGPNGADGTDGKVGISGTDGKDAVSISGKGGVGHIGLTGPKGADGTPGKDGISIDITTDLNTATLDDGKNVKTVIKDKEGKETTIDQAPRIQYKSGDNTYEVATMDDGLKFVGNDGKEVTKKLNSTLSLTGGITDADALQKASGRNLGVRSNKDGNGLEIVMTDTPDFTKVTVGEGDDTTKKITIGNQTVTGKKSDGTDGTAEKGNYITGLDNTKWNKDNVVENRAATEGQLRDIAGSITNQNQGGGFALTSDEKGTDKIVKQDLGKAIQIKGDTTYKADGSVEKAGNIKTSIDNGAIKVELNKDVDLGNGGSVSAGQTKVDQNGVYTNKITIKDSTISISKDGINGGSKQITNVASGASEIIKGEGGKDVYKYDNDTNAANIGDVKRIAGDMKTEINNNVTDVTNKVNRMGDELTQVQKDVKADRTYQGDDGAAKKVKVKFGSFLSLTGGAKLADLTEEGNIGVVQKEIDDPDHKGEKIAGLSVRLAKHLNLEKTTYTSNENGQTYTSEIDGKGLTIKTGDENRNITVQDGNVNMGGNQIHNVAPGQAPGDAVNVSQLNATNYAVNKLGTRVNRVGAGAAALAALHPLDFDPDDKWDFAAGYGNYKDASAVAVGAYYRPNEDTMFNIGGSFGGGENMVNAGVSFKVGQGNHVSTSRVAMAKEIKDLRQNVANLNAIVNRQSALIDKLTGTNAGMIKDKGNDLFPDVPANHWAYEYVTKLKQAGILTGYPDGNFDGDRMMTRYEFAAIVYRSIMAGAASNPALNQDGTLDKLANEFSSEMKYIRIDTIAKDKNGKPTIERVRVIPDTQHDVQS